MKRFSEDNFIMRKKVIIETEECIGCESCVEHYPDVFEFDEEAEKAEVILPEGGGWRISNLEIPSMTSIAA
jgi:Fe-S-cluster-containing dehydrogenase component